ncbi:hypothetical protein F2Q68_00001983, partial [Brassica cretica]
GVFFPNLKSLSLVSVGFWDTTTYEYLISGCPLLDELLLSYGHPSACNGFGFIPSIQVSNPAIKIKRGAVARKYTVDLGLLVEARLDIRSKQGRVLVVEEDCFDVVEDDDDDDDDDDEDMPVFQNLVTLSFESEKERGWQVLPLLLNNSPNLETLAIKGLLHKVTDRCGDACVCIAKKKKKKMEEQVCCLSTCQVKVLNISKYGGTRRELRQMRHFLGNLKCLETVKVGVKAENHREDNNVNNNYPRITNAPTTLPRASSNCQIHFF